MPAPEWVNSVVDAFEEARPSIDSTVRHGASSDTALSALRPGLTELA